MTPENKEEKYVLDIDFRSMQKVNTMRNDKAFNQPLRPGDTEKQTVGCRHTNPDICAKNRLPGKCAFVRNDKMCLAPPSSWLKQYRKLKQVR